MKPPIEPNKEDCCNSSCNPCIFDVYEKQLRLYKSYIENGECTSVGKENAMSQLKYKQFYLTDNVDICKQHRLLLFKQDELESDKKVFWDPGEHFLVKYRSGKEACTRAYTPIKLEQIKGDYDFAIIVKSYINGVVSNHLCNLQVGDSSLWRGPYGHYQVDPDKFCRLIMIAQGTGITPLFSIIKNILNDEENMIKIILLYCCKCIDTILLRNELYELKSYWNFEYVIHLSKSLDNSKLKYKEPITLARLTAKDVLDFKPFTDKDQFLMCGSENFMKQYSKLLQENYVPCINIVKF